MKFREAGSLVLLAGLLLQPVPGITRNNRDYAFASTTATEHSTRCSLSPIPRWSVDNRLYFVGAATGRVVRTGAGATLIPAQGDETSANIGADIRGVEIAVERLARSRPAGIPQTTSHVVVVQWSYGPSCGLERPSSAPPPVGKRALLHGVLRPREFWAEGKPTIDIFPYGYSVPSAESALAFLATIDSLPGDSSIRANPSASLAAVHQWSELRGTKQVSTTSLGLHDAVLQCIQDAFARELRPEYSGTYRLTVRTDSGATFRTFLRIGSAPSGAVDNDRAVPSMATSDGLVGSHVRIATVTAPTESQLFGESGVSRDHAVEGTLIVRTSPEQMQNRSRVWRGQLMLFANFGEISRVEAEQFDVRISIVSDPGSLLLYRPTHVNTHLLKAISVVIEQRPNGSIVILPTRADGLHLVPNLAYGAELLGERVSLRSFAPPYSPPL